MIPYTTGIGIMSGTSLDGLDLAWCGFSELGEGRWDYKVLDAKTIPYPDEFRERLARATEMSALEYCRLDVALGERIADEVNAFIGDRERPAFIASHGHTVFHQPDKGLTTQIGSGAIIAARTGIPTVSDFRAVDVALQGQGAPLVPIGDELLFASYDACLNLGGFSNISFRHDGRRVAFDISPCNMALNLLARHAGMAYDADGAMAASGQCLPDLLDALNRLEYYALPGPKSLGKEWFETCFQPLLEPCLHKGNIADGLRTVVEHIAQQIARALPESAHTLLVTGGGALNRFLIQRIAALYPGTVTVPDKQIVEFKEALIFAFLGLLRINHRINTLRTVTGAMKDSCGGCVWRP